MKIGKLVQSYIEKIFQHCDDGELRNLMDKQYSKNTFGINYPFCAEIENIPHVRYWTAIHPVKDKTLRVCSQWFEGNRERFCNYIISKNIVESPLPCPPPAASPAPRVSQISPALILDSQVIENPVVKAAQLAFSVRPKDSNDVSANTKNAQAIAKAWRGAVHELDPDRFQIEATVAPELDQKIDIVDSETACAYEFKVSGKNAPAEFYKDIVKVIIWNQKRRKKLSSRGLLRCPRFPHI